MIIRSGQKTVPVFVINDGIVIGFDQPKLDAIFEG